MNFRGPLIVCAALLAGAVAAQTAAPSQTVQNDRWETVPAAASSAHYRADPASPASTYISDNAFHFKQPVKRGPAYQPPPQANDKAAVMGKQRPWQNGVPPVDCAMTPRDPACH